MLLLLLLLSPLKGGAAGQAKETQGPGGGGGGTLFFNVSSSQGQGLRSCPHAGLGYQGKYCGRVGRGCYGATLIMINQKIVNSIRRPAYFFCELQPVFLRLGEQFLKRKKKW